MNINRKGVAAVGLIVIGILMVFGKFSPLLHSLMGHLMGLIFPIALIALGYFALQNGRKVLGTILAAIGTLVLFSKLSFLIGPMIGIALVAGGIYMLKSRRQTY